MLNREQKQFLRDAIRPHLQPHIDAIIYKTDPHTARSALSSVMLAEDAYQKHAYKDYVAINLHNEIANLRKIYHDYNHCRQLLGSQRSTSQDIEKLVADEIKKRVQKHLESYGYERIASKKARLATNPVISSNRYLPRVSAAYPPEARANTAQASNISSSYGIGTYTPVQPQTQPKLNSATTSRISGSYPPEARANTAQTPNISYTPTVAANNPVPQQNQSAPSSKSAIPSKYLRWIKEEDEPAPSPTFDYNSLSSSSGVSASAKGYPPVSSSSSSPAVTAGNPFLDSNPFLQPLYFSPGSPRVPSATATPVPSVISTPFDTPSNPFNPFAPTTSAAAQSTANASDWPWNLSSGSAKGYPPVLSSSSSPAVTSASANSNSLSNADALNKARAWVKKGDKEDNLMGKFNCYTKAIELFPIGTTAELAYAYYKRAYSRHIICDSYPDIIKDYTKAIRLYPIDRQTERAKAYCERAVEHGRSGNYQKKIKDLTKAIVSYPDDQKTYIADAYYQRALTNHTLGNPNTAINDYTQAINILRAICTTSEIVSSLAYYYEKRASLYGELGKNEKQDADRKKSNIIYSNFERMKFNECTNDINAHPSPTTSSLAQELAGLYETRCELYEGAESERDIEKCRYFYDLSRKLKVVECTQAIELCNIGDTKALADAYLERAKAYHAVDKNAEAVADCTRTIGLLGKFGNKTDIANAYAVRGFANSGGYRQRGTNPKAAISDIDEAIRLGQSRYTDAAMTDTRNKMLEMLEEKKFTSSVSNTSTKRR